MTLLYSYTKFFIVLFSTAGIFLAVVLNTYITLTTRKNKNYVLYLAMSISMICLLTLMMLDIVAPSSQWRSGLLMLKIILFTFFHMIWIGFILNFIFDKLPVKKWFLFSSLIAAFFVLIAFIQTQSPILFTMNQDAYYEPTLLLQGYEIISIILFGATLILLILKHRLHSSIKRRLLYVLTFSLIIGFIIANGIMYFANFMGYPLMTDRLIYTYFMALIAFVMYSRSFKFIDFVPDMMPSILNRLEEGIIVCDKNLTILEVNDSPPMSSIQVTSGQNLIQGLASLGLSKQEDVVAFLSDLSQAPQSIKLSFNDHASIFSMDVSPLFDQKAPQQKALIGYVLVIKDITEYEKLLKNVERKNTELFEVNKSLMDYALIVEKLSIEREKNALYLHFQNTLGYSMNVLADMLAQCKDENIPLDQLDQKLDQSLKFSRDILAEIRSAVKNYSKN